MKLSHSRWSVYRRGDKSESDRDMPEVTQPASDGTGSPVRPGSDLFWAHGSTHPPPFPPVSHQLNYQPPDPPPPAYTPHSSLTG